MLLAAVLPALAVCAIVGAHELSPSNQTGSEQNLCVLKHMLYAYTDSDDVTISNVITLFDSVTTGYHDKAPADHDGNLSADVRTSLRPY